MKEVGVSKKDLLRDIERDILISKYVESILEEEEFVVTEQEIVDFYNLLSNQQELPPYEEVESELEASIISQKQSEIISGIVTTLYEESEVETSL